MVWEWTATFFVPRSTYAIDSGCAGQAEGTVYSEAIISKTSIELFTSQSSIEGLVFVADFTVRANLSQLDLFFKTTVGDNCHKEDADEATRGVDRFPPPEQLGGVLHHGRLCP